MPEARIILAQASTYLATAPKSNASYQGIETALNDIRSGQTLPVPRALRSTGSKRAAKEFGHEGYQYVHDFKERFVDQEYAPTSKIYYEPTDQGYEETIKKRIEYWNGLRKKPRAKKEEAGTE
jgi:putative ATPase